MDGKEYEIKMNKIMKNSFWMIFERIIQMIIALFINIFITRYLGAANYGLLNYSSSYIGLFLSISSLGLESIIINELVNSPDKEGEILGSSIFLRTLSGLFSIISVVIIVRLSNGNNLTLLIISILQALILFFRIYELLEYWFQAKYLSKYVTIIKISTYIIVTVYKLFLLFSKKSVVWFAFSNSLDCILIFILMICFFKKKSNINFSISKKMCIKLISRSYHFIWTGLMISIYGETDKLMLGKLKNAMSVGIYSAGSYISGLANFIPYALINSLRPMIMEEKMRNNEKYLELLKDLYSIVFYFCLILAIFFTLFSKIIVCIIYGNGYNGAEIVLIIFSFSTIFSMLNVVRDIWFVCEEKEYLSKYIYLVGIIVNIILNYFLIKLFGYYGAAIASLSSNVLTAIIIPMILKSTKENVKILVNSLSIFRLKKAIKNIVFNKKLI